MDGADTLCEISAAKIYYMLHFLPDRNIGCIILPQEIISVILTARYGLVDDLVA